MQNYTIVEEIANGRTARVYKAIAKQDKRYVAIKCVRDMKNRKLNELMRNEVDILKMCQSLNIIKMLDFFEKEKEGLLFIVLEYCNGGNLKDYVLQQKDGKLTEKESLSILQQIIQGFKILSEHNCLHRDFKAENILLHNGVAKIADFGGSVMMKEVEQLHKSYFGTQAIFAPERMRCSLYGNKADVYSLGAVFYFMLYGSYPTSSGLKEISEKKGKPLSEIAQMFLQRSLQSDKGKRISWDEIFQMNFNPLKALIVSRLPSNYNKLASRRTNVDKLEKRSSMPETTNKLKSLVPAFQRLISEESASQDTDKQKQKEKEKEKEKENSRVDDSSKINLYRLLDELEKLRTLYTEEAENHLFKLEFVHKAMARIAQEFGKVYFNEDSVLIIKCILTRLKKLLGWVQNRENIFNIPEQTFKRFTAHEIYSELAGYIKTIIADIEPHYDTLSKPLIQYIRKKKLNLAFADELEKPEINKKLFFNYMLDFCFRLDGLLPCTKNSDSKVRIMLLRYMALEMLADRPMRRTELTRALDDMGSSTIEELEKKLSSKFQEVTATDL